jgi:hypothetical protein
MVKLIIITSSGHDEYNNYWKRANPHENVIIIDKYRRNTEKDKDIVRETLRCSTENEAMVLIHKIDQSPFKQSIQVDKISVNCQYCYYSTQMNLSDLWSFGDMYNSNKYYSHTVPDEMPALPMDKLCWALNQVKKDDTIIKTACDEIIEYFQKKIIYTNRLEEVLEALHFCLGGSICNTDIFSNFTQEEKNIIQVEIATLKEDPNSQIESFEAFRNKILDMV